ncbi:MAG: extracellular solute-binding protein [Spirochaetota bacterium]
MMRYPLTLVLAVLCMLPSGICASNGHGRVTVSHAFALRGKPKYGPDFTHFDYVNPDAPKGGTIVFHSVGTFDNFNRFAQRGVAAVESGSLYDPLMKPSEDEVDVYYGLVAEKIEYPDDYTWVTFHINPNARFHDGEPITADDVVFTFNKFLNEGVPQFKQYFRPVTGVSKLSTYRVRFTLEHSNRKMIQSLADLSILPEHYWKDRNFSEPAIEVPVGSSPYYYSDYRMGQYVELSLLPDYWAKDLPVNVGYNNFAVKRYDYYRDQNVAFEAFKAGEYDFYEESSAKNWATMYTGSPFDDGSIVQEEIKHEIPQAVQALVFNTKHPLFEDIRVREAVSLMFDFEWMNTYLFYNQYKRTTSFFQNTPYEANTPPAPEELKILERYRGTIPDEVFTTVYTPPVTDGSGWNREQIRRAIVILKGAGWELERTRMVHAETGKQMRFEFLTYSPTMERMAIPFQRNLGRIGIRMDIRTVDKTQFINRLRNRDFDMITGSYGTTFYPSDDLYFYFHSDFIDSTYNTAGVDSPTINDLIERIVASQYDEKRLIHLGRALDRVLMHSHFIIPQWYLNRYRIAYRNIFSRPAVRPRYSLGLSTWWYDPHKEQTLKNSEEQ